MTPRCDRPSQRRKPAILRVALHLPAVWGSHEGSHTLQRARMHGGASTGQKTPEGRQRIVQARTKHGRYSAENRRVAAMIRELKAAAKRLVELT
jgi:hypothetical protein